MSRFNNVELTTKSIQAARQHFADNAAACIAEVLYGAVKVNDPEGYIVDYQNRHEAFLSGDYDHTFTLLQYAYYVQTGESIALLP